MDDLDHKLLALLRRNARISASELAKGVSLSRTAVRNRLKKLENIDVIQGYTIIEGQLSTKSDVTTFLFIERNDRMRGADIFSHMKKFPEITFCHILSGEFDVLMRVCARDHERVQEIWKSFSQLQGVKSITTSYSLKNFVF